MGPRRDAAAHPGNCRCHPAAGKRRFSRRLRRRPEGVAVNVTRCIATGVAGLSIEDSTGKRSDLFMRRSSQSREYQPRVGRSTNPAPGSSDRPLRSVSGGSSRSVADIACRLVAYAEAGADCLYAPGASAPEEISAIVRAVAPKPVNILVSGFNSQLSLAQLADLGVRRISVGSGLALAAWGALTRAAARLPRTGLSKCWRAALDRPN